MIPLLPQPPQDDYAQRLNVQLMVYLRDIYAKLDNLQGSSWNGSHPVLGGNHIWIDASTRLRIKSSTPLSDVDGTVIGTQV